MSFVTTAGKNIGRPLRVDGKRAAELRRQGLTWRVIATRLGCSPNGAMVAVRKLEGLAGAFSGVPE